MIAIVTALKEELSPLLRRAKIDRIDRGAYVGTLGGIPVVMKCTGVGVANAEKNLNDLLHRFTKIDSIIAAGVAGAIAPHLKRGDIIVDEESGRPGRSVRASRSDTDDGDRARRPIAAGETPALRGSRIATVEKITRDKKSI